MWDPVTATDGSVWQVSKMTLTDNDTQIEYHLEREGDSIKVTRPIDQPLEPFDVVHSDTPPPRQEGEMIASELRPGLKIPAADAYGEFQIVTSVVRLPNGLLRVVTKDDGSFIRSWQFVPDEPVRFPRDERYKRQWERERSAVMDLPGYIGVFKSPITGAYWKFLKHPTGRGRWPSDVIEYDATKAPRGFEDEFDQEAREIALGMGMRLIACYEGRKPTGKVSPRYRPVRVPLTELQVHVTKVELEELRRKYTPQPEQPKAPSPLPWDD